jgi:3-oxoacyl-[acyl-carrier protein] reductase
MAATSNAGAVRTKPSDRQRASIVTGGASGIGLAIARRLSADGLAVVIADIDGGGARAACEGLVAIGGRADWVQVDVTDESANIAMVDRVMSVFGGLDVLVLNAGMGTAPAPFQEMDQATWSRVFTVNVTSAFLGMKAALPALRLGLSPSVVMTSSLMGVRPRGGYAAYGSAKAAIVHLAKSLAAELAPDRIRVNVIAPTATETPMFKTFAGDLGEEKGREVFSAAIPFGRLAEPREIAGAASYLVSDEAAFITGQVITIDGGRGI